MASFLDKFKIKTAVDSHSRRNINSLHVTTTDWMDPSIAYFQELAPKTKVKLNMRSMARMSALTQPTFGSANMHNRAYFVPLWQIFPAFHDMMTDSLHTCTGNNITAGAYISNTPLIRNRSVVDLFNDPALGLASSVASTVAYDIVIYNDVSGTPTPAYKVLTPLGRRVFKIFSQLGYRINWDVSTTSSPGYTETFSALPFYAYMKVFLDWYFPPSFYGDSRRATLEQIIQSDDGSTHYLSKVEMWTFFSWLSSCMYDSDYFVSAFENPVAPNSQGGFSSISISDTTVAGNNASNISTRPNGTPIIQGQTSQGNALYPTNLSEFALHSLHKLTDYMVRHQLAGGRSIERWLARFGLTLNIEKMKRCQYLGDYSVPLIVQDVMSNADTASAGGAALGDYAGKGMILGKSDGTFTISSGEEFGFLIVINTIVPRIGYVQGFQRHVLHKSRFDFWTPEFDGIGKQAIAKGELYVPLDGSSPISATSLQEGVFGFTSRYAEYKVDRDMISGDFMLGSKSAAGLTSPAWHLARLFDDSSFSNSASNIVHSQQFVMGTDSAQYNRIFDNTSNTADHFVIQHFFGGSVDAPMKSLFDDYEFMDNGKEVTVEANGVKVN